MKKAKKQSRIKPLKKWMIKHRLTSILIITSLLVILVLFWALFTKIVLLVNFLIGIEATVNLNVDQREISLTHGQEEAVTFEASVTTNPFCKTSCKSGFTDISKNKKIDSIEFILKPGIPFKKRYKIKSTTRGTGLYLYRFDMECHSVRTVFCPAREELSTRSILITVNHTLSEEEKKAKEIVQKRLENITSQLSILEGDQIIFDGLLKNLNKSIIIDDENIYTYSIIIVLEQKIVELKELWINQTYLLLDEETAKTENEVLEAKRLFAEAKNNLTNIVNSYNAIVDNLNKTKAELEDCMDFSFINDTQIIKLNNAINLFNDALPLFAQKTILSEKEALEKNISEEVEGRIISIKNDIEREVIKKKLELGIDYETLCTIRGQCIYNLSIEKLANQSQFNLNSTCGEISDLREIYVKLNESIKDDLIAQSYPNTNNFWDNVSAKIGNIKNNIKIKYLEELPENGGNTPIIMEFLREAPFIETENYSEYNLTLALISELIKQQPPDCNISNITLNRVMELPLNKIETTKGQPIDYGIVFEEPLPRCCVFGKCKDCCITEECRKDPFIFPVVFLHGHAVNKDFSAEYSLEGFNKIQKKLEEEGYLNIGTFTLYSIQDFKSGVLGLLQTPLTIRASYYFDIFRQPENYVVVQTKSENIDTYAIRLKELIDAIKLATDRPKVDIIAFSMGGLVARRYIQIFGSSSINKLILIGTPNKGITGSTADYCSLTGERLECRDMNAESLFINKLNNNPLPKIPVYNIIGSGCQMDQGIGDGTVLLEKAWLEGAYNYVINGSCPSKVEPLHLTLRNIEKYPEVYDIIKRALNDEFEK